MVFFLAFWGGIFPCLALIYSLVSPHASDLFSYWPWIFFVLILLDSGHVFFSLPALLSRSDMAFFRGRWNQALLLAPTLLAISVVYYSRPAFLHLVAYSTLIHIVRQHWGILKREIIAKLKDRWVIRLNIWTFNLTIIFSILYWHSTSTSLSDRYFSDHDLLRFIPGEILEPVAPIVIVLFLATMIITLWRATWANRIGTASALFFQVGTFIWFYGGLVRFSDTPLFWILTPIEHGLIYIAYIYLDTKAMHNMPKSRWLKIVLSRAMIYSLILLVIIVLWAVFRKSAIAQAFEPIDSHLNRLLLTLIWVPAFLHYTLDSIIWRRKFHQREIESLTLSRLPSR